MEKKSSERMDLRYNEKAGERSGFFKYLGSSVTVNEKVKTGEVQSEEAKRIT